MHIYRLKPDSRRYKDIVVRREDDARRLLRLIEATPLGAEWTPVDVEILDDPDNRSRLSGDYPSMNGVIPILSSRAVEALGDLLTPSGEILPLACPDGDYSAFNVTRVVDALDADRSTLKYLTSNMLGEITRYQFRPGELSGVGVFKIPQQRRGGKVYVTDDFMRRVQQAGLTGFSFEEVWTDEPG